MTIETTFDPRTRMYTQSSSDPLHSRGTAAYPPSTPGAEQIISIICYYGMDNGGRWAQRMRALLRES